MRFSEINSDALFHLRFLALQLQWERFFNKGVLSILTIETETRVLAIEKRMLDITLRNRILNGKIRRWSKVLDVAQRMYQLRRVELEI